MKILTKIFVILLIILWINVNISLCQYCTYTEETETLLCQNYTTLNGVDLDLDGKKIGKLILRPIEKRAHSFGDELIIFFDKIKSDFADGYDVLLENFIDFDIGFNPFYTIYLASGPGASGNTLTIDRSVLEFKSNGIDVNCASYVSSTQKKIFAMFREIHLGANTVYRDGQCPVIFGEAELDLFTLSGVDYAENSFSLAKFNSGLSVFRSRVDRVEISDANLRTLGSAILNIDVFKQTREIAYHSGFRSPGLLDIENNLFFQFKALRWLEISLWNFELFALSSSGTWMSFLNPEKVDNYQLHLIDQGKSYVFPNKDFCSFSQLSTSSKIIVRIEGKESIECTCTLAFLIQNSPSTTQTETTRDCFEDNSYQLEELKRTCNFTTRVQECNRLRQTTTPAPTTRTVATTRAIDEKPKVDNTTTIVFGVLGGVTILIIVAVLAFYYRRKTVKKSQSQTRNANGQYDENINIVKVKP